MAAMDTQPDKAAPTADATKLTIADLDAALANIKKGVSTEEPRFILRVLRSMGRIRKNLGPVILQAALSRGISPAEQGELAALLGQSTAVDDKAATGPVLPEIDLFVRMLVVMYLIDQNRLEAAVAAANSLTTRLTENKRRTSNEIVAKCYFFIYRAHELAGSASSIRGMLHAALRTATLRKNASSQATVLNLLLRNYINDNLFAQAEMLVSKTVFPESATNADAARYLYSLGRIKAVQLEYSEAHANLLLATRKAPKSAVGFLQTAHKLAVIVQMLLGEIPERELFRTPSLRRSLQPYFQLTQAVRIGDLGKFQEIVQTHRTLFCRDRNYNLILRLRHNVIKTGIRMINLSYSRISLQDIATKLQLDSAEDAEFIVAKAIRDGVVDATLDHDQGFLRSNEVTDLYSTLEPQDAFHQRITFCLKTHNEAVKAMRFPPNAYRKYLETNEQRKEREVQEAELAKELEEDEDMM